MRVLFSVLLSLFFALTSVWAQVPKKLPKVPKTARVKTADIPQINLPKVFNRLPEPVLRKYGSLLYNSHLADRISARAYPRLARYNDLLAARSLERFTVLEEVFQTHQLALAANIQSAVTETVPYARLLPKEVDVLYIGEVHQEARVQEEIAGLVKSLRAVYPNRTVYLAAESVPCAFGKDFTVEDLIRSREKLQERLAEEAELLGLDEMEVLASAQVVEAALEQKIAVLGLENEEELLEFTKTEEGEYPTEEQYQQVVTSFAGMEFRNKGFARLINGLRAYDPKALVVFYGGIDHAAYHGISSLPEMVGGRSFVVQVTVPGALAQTHPIFKNFREGEEIRAQFHESPSAKLVEWWKEPADFNRVLGNDLTIIVHEE